MLVVRSRSDGRAALVRGCIGVGFALAASLTYVPLCLHVRNWHTRCRKMIVEQTGLGHHRDIIRARDTTRRTLSRQPRGTVSCSLEMFGS